MKKIPEKINKIWSGTKNKTNISVKAKGKKK